MKKGRIAISLFLLVACLFSFSSCLLMSSGYGDEYMTEDEIRKLIDGQIGGNVTVEGGDSYDITIDGGTNSIAAAASKGLLSAVSVWCNFTVKSGIYPSKTTTATSTGSGVIYQLDKEQGDAYIITNYHVVYNNMATTSNGISNDITVYLYGQEPQTVSGYGIPATYVGGSMNYDLAVLRIEDSRVLAESNVRAVDFADSNEVAVLDMAIAIGNAASAGISATVGYVNVDSEYLEMEGADGYTEISLRVMRIDTAVNGGNSGGGLFDNKGNLIGIVNAKMVDSEIDSIGYAIPSNVVKYITENILYYCADTDKESVYRCLMGITVAAIEAHSEYDTQTGRVLKKETVAVNTVEANSLASGVLKSGDVIRSITIDGVSYTVDRMYKVVDSMLNARVGSEVTVHILRDGVEMSVDINITEGCLVAY